MNARQLFYANGAPSKSWECGACGQLYVGQALEGPGSSAKSAEQCCICLECGEPKPAKDKSLSGVRYTCMPCQNKLHERREQERFEKAEKVDQIGPDEMVCWGDEYARDLDTLLEYIDTSGADRPPFVWVCPGSPVLDLDADRIIENATDNAYEDFDSDSLVGIEEFTVATVAFYQANVKHLSYYPDYKRAIAVPPLEDD